MSPYLQFVVSVGHWVQHHQTVVIAVSVTFVFLLGGVRLVRHTAFRSHRRPRL